MRTSSLVGVVEGVWKKQTRAGVRLLFCAATVARQLNWSEMLKSTPVYPSASITRTRHLQPSASQMVFDFWGASENAPISLWLQDPRHGPEIP